MFSRFVLSLTVFEIQGAQNGKNAIFEATSKFYFSSNFDGIFFHWIPLNEIFQTCYSQFFLSLTVFEIIGAKGAKNVILGTTENFHFSSDFNGIFFIGFLSMGAFRIVTADLFYLLPFSRYKGPKRAKTQFLRPHQIFIFYPILVGFFSLDSSQ